LKSNKFWIVLLCVVVLISAAVSLFLWYRATGSAAAGYARIYKDGELFTAPVNLLAVTEPFRVVVDGITDGITDAGRNSGGFNVIEVECGRLRMSESDCPFGICVQRGWVSGSLMPIVCLPNRVVVVFDGSSADVDAVVG